MTQIIALAATARDRAGKGTARATRRAGSIPAVIYGNKEKPVMIALDTTKFTREIHRPGFFTHLFDITVDGVTHRVLPRDVQLDPVYDRPLHADFLRVSDTTEITLKVPVEFVNVETCPGIKKGGILNIVRHDIEVFAKAADLPEKITVDLAGFEVGSSIHISSVKLPEGVRPTITDRDFTVATIAAPTVKADA
ncbi:50S ribosomal protein L25/general stress protein Ctc [Niveispirillum cyanobacteriorum]|jgi:large subunit ribosomal protein L25|uniref:Large ribosomal subunit protein bL25 n=1 Tax=Niveispirillum cyanobacteriorum TaxID=1612173 RepID=A0A2K9NCA6_9PROT|nr:50S ribosomal protein L25/general stress protein Ctc [Niveispirillum cyanobacteriorum]AUN29805.1 50S ribosomal protein L25 [Niveispirillum cyanobacteriorum]GGE60573.1 50S ribosomal protein L25 [Niveispirillum cyanobacteriorum]